MLQPVENLLERVVAQIIGPWIGLKHLFLNCGKWYHRVLEMESLKYVKAINYLSKPTSKLCGPNPIWYYSCLNDYSIEI